MKGLQFLDISTNELTGELPESIWNLPELRSLRLFKNELTGTISSSIKNMLALEYLSLKDNLWSGSLPNILLAESPTIDTIKLDENRLTGTIPFWILCGRNRKVDLDTNYFEGFAELPDFYPEEGTLEMFLATSCHGRFLMPKNHQKPLPEKLYRTVSIFPIS